MSAAELLEKAKRLTASERWELANHLWDTLSNDQGVPVDGLPEPSESAVSEIVRRQQIVSSGEYKTFDADESQARILRALEEVRRP